MCDTLTVLFITRTIKNNTILHLTLLYDHTYLKLYHIILHYAIGKLFVKLTESLHSSIVYDV